MARQQINRLYQFFEITSVCRADLVEALHISEEEAREIDDSDMREIASKLADAYCENVFWIDLPIIAEDVLGIEVRKREA